MERRETVTEAIIQALVALQVPWRGDYGFPRNIISRLRYDGVNPLLLNLAAEKHGWTSPYWGTHSQWGSQGCTPNPRPEHVKIGEWFPQIVLYKPPTSGTMKQELDRWAVFNLEQIASGFSSLRSQQLNVNFGAVDRIIESTNAKINFEPGLVAGYFYASDEIVFPLKEQFVQGPGGLPGYYHSLAHEVIGHWTEPRLSWDAGEWGNELRAEICADYFCTELGIPRLDMSMRPNHKKYLDKWVTMMRQDPDLIFRVTAAASRAVDLVLSFSQKVEPRHNPPMVV